MRDPKADSLDYVLDHYGSCFHGAACRCMSPYAHWLGRGCLNWRPAENALEILDYLYPHRSSEDVGSDGDGPLTP
jgi:hypothetical protein